MGGAVGAGGGGGVGEREGAAAPLPRPNRDLGGRAIFRALGHPNALGAMGRLLSNAKNKSIDR